MARPTLPRLRRGRARGDAGDVVERTEPRISELSADGLTWVHAERPGALEVGVPRRALRLPRARHRGRPLQAAAAEDRRVPGLPLRRPALPLLRQERAAPERGRARRLPRPGLPDHAPERRAPPRHAPLPALRGRPRAAAGALPRGRATCSTTSSTTSSTTASRSSTRSGPSSTRSSPRSSRGAPRTSSATSRTRSRRSSPTARSSSPSARRCACSSGRHERFLPEDLELYFDDIVDAAERIWDLLDNYKEVIEGLESTNESFISHKQQYRLQLLTVVTVILLPLTLIASIFGMNVGVPARGARGVLGARRRHGRHRRRAARALPLAALAVSARPRRPVRRRVARRPRCRRLVAEPLARTSTSGSTSTTRPTTSFATAPTRRSASTRSPSRTRSIRAAAEGRRLRGLRLPRRLRVDAGRGRPRRGALLLLRALPRHGAPRRVAGARRPSAQLRARAGPLPRGSAAPPRGARPPRGRLSSPPSRQSTTRLDAIEERVFAWPEARAASRTSSGSSAGWSASGGCWPRSATLVARDPAGAAELPGMTHEAERYFRDVYDHLIGSPRRSTVTASSRTPRSTPTSRRPRTG